MKLEIDVDTYGLFGVIRGEVYKADNIGLHHLNDYTAHDIQMLCYALEDELSGIQSLETLLDYLCDKNFINNLIRIGRKTYGTNADSTTKLYTLLEETQ